MRTVPAVAFLALVLASGCGGGGGGDSAGGAGGGADAAGSTGAGAGADTLGVPDGSQATCPVACDDGLPCTEDRCVGGKCVAEVKPGFCLTAEGCFTDGEFNPSNACLVCRPDVANDAWSPVPEDTPAPCDDGDPCTTDDACKGGTCTGVARDCDDGEPCTDDACDAATGDCTHEPGSGAACDDGDPCTAGDTCDQGTCAGTEPACDDGDPCTDDACDNGACSSQAVDCDDGNPCTQDGCDSGSGCTHTAAPDGTACEAGDHCLAGDHCVGGACVEGADPVVCDDDGNPCTDDQCDPQAGCIHPFLLGDPCDDGEACTQDDTCNSSMCVGIKTATCDSCASYSFGPIIQKATEVSISGDGQPGSGLDVDDNPETCAPVGNCAAGIDNAMAAVANAINAALKVGLETGGAVMIAEIRDFKTEGTPFVLSLYEGFPDWSSKPNCDLVKDVCDYQVSWWSFDAKCIPTVYLENVVVDSYELTDPDKEIYHGTMHGGGTEDIFVLQLPLSQADQPVPFFIVNGKFQGEFTVYGDPSKNMVMTGIFAGAVPMDSLIDTIMNVDPKYFDPLTNQQVADLITQLVDPDIDLDGDGQPDAVSVGIRVTTIPGVITGIAGAP